MPATLFKLVMSAVTETHTNPEVQRFFYLLDPEDIDEGTLTIEAGSFLDDVGDTATVLPTATEDDGYYQLFVNGVLQQADLYTVEATSVTVDNADEIPEDAPIVLAVINYAPISVTTITS